MPKVISIMEYTQMQKVEMFLTIVCITDFLLVVIS